MKKDYTTYQADQLLNDDYFLMSEQHPTSESEVFWVTQQKLSPPLVREIELARKTMNAFKRSSSRLSDDDVNLLWSRIKQANARQNKKGGLFVVMAWSAAACIAVILAGSWFFMEYAGTNKEMISSIETVQKPNKQITDIHLILSEDKAVVVGGKASQIHYKKDGQVHVNSETANETIEKGDKSIYNQLIVPAGKSSSITFADGTKVWVNAGSRLVYPATFAKEYREVYVEGEIYLEVAPDVSKPFIVKTDRLQVRVLGTKFNVNAYTDNVAHEIALVSGKVEVAVQGNENTVLRPNQLFSYSDGLSKVQIVNASEYISWKDGIYQYHHEKLDQVFKHLSRYYNKQIECGEGIGTLTCSGKLDLKSSISDVLKALQKAAAIEVIETDQKIYINVKL